MVKEVDQMSQMSEKDMKVKKFEDNDSFESEDLSD